MRTLNLAVVLLATFLVAGCDNLARWTYNMALDAEKARAGLEDHHVTTGDGLEWHYLRSKGAADKPAVLLVHGFGADSSNWVRFANALEGEFRFIIPDLPGHGDSTATTDMRYDIALQAERLHRLMAELGVPRFHVAGNSMGGAIAIRMAEQQPDRLLSMGLVDAAGLGIVTKAFDELLQNGGSNPLIPREAEDFFTTLDWAMEEPPYMPDFFIRVMGEKKAANAPVADKVWHDISEPGDLDYSEEMLSSIRVPTLIVWGDRDKLLPVESAHRFDDLLPNSRKMILSGIGHVPMAEAPDKTAVFFRTFWMEANVAQRRQQQTPGNDTSVPAKAG